MIGAEKGVSVGAPLVAGASVKAEVLEQTRGPKIIVFKKKRRKNYRRTQGHRQDLTVLRITGISEAKTEAKKPAKRKAKAAAEDKTEKKAPAPKAETAPEAEAKPAAAKAKKKAPSAKPEAGAKEND